MSINNIVSALMVVNNVPASKCHFLRPQNDEDFEPWKYSCGVTNMNFDHVIDDSNARPVTKLELIDWLAKQ